MGKKDFIKALRAKNPELTLQELDDVATTFFDSIASAICQDARIEIRGFGSFGAKSRKAKYGFNPKTLEKIKLTNRRLVSFRQSEQFMAELNDNNMGNNGIGNNSMGNNIIGENIIEGNAKGQILEDNKLKEQ